MKFWLLLALLIPSEATNDVKADDRVHAARLYVSSRSYPAKLSYRIAVTLVKDDGAKSLRTYDSGYDGSDNIVFTHSISEEEAARPIHPSGVNLVVGLSASTSTGSTGTSIQINRSADDPDVIGVPMLSPTYTFGLGHEAATERYANAGPYAVIAVTSAVEKEYAAAYLGDETIRGEVCAHVRLSPTKDPAKYRLRDLWVASDGAPLQLETHGNFSSRPWDGLDWIVSYRRAGSALYLASEETVESVRVDRYRRGHVVVSFFDIEPSDPRQRFFLIIEPNNPVREP